MNTGEMRYILERELSSLDVACPVRFVWSAAETVITLDKGGVEINLRMAEGEEDVLRFLARYAAEAVFLNETAKTVVPESWLHGLACREAKEDRLMLGLLRRKLPKRRTWFTPAALWCSYRAAEDKEVLSGISALPEVGWYGGKYPESALARLLRAEDAESLVKQAAQADDPFSVGLCLRLSAIGAMDRKVLSPEKEELVLAAAERFRSAAAKLSGQNMEGMLRPYMTAAEDMAAKMNRWFSAQTHRAGAAVYPMGDSWRIK